MERQKLACGRTLAASVIGASLLWGCGGGGSGGFSMPLPPSTTTGPTASTTATPTTSSSGTGTGTNGSDAGPVAGNSAGTNANGTAPAEKREDIPKLTEYVNLFIGTKISDTGSGHSGNVNPGAQTPFGMVSFGPDTRGSGSPWGYGSGGYYYDDNAIRYFSMTHLNGPGCRGQGAVAILPNSVTGGIPSGGLSYAKANQSAKPGYYKVKFDNGITSELTATTRTGMARIGYADKDKAFLVIDSARNNPKQDGVPYSNLTDIALGADLKSVSGKAVANEFCGGTWKQPVYYYASFDKPLKNTGSAISGKAATLQFDLKGNDLTVQVRVGISSVSVANAKKNLETENLDASFDTVKATAESDWNSRLNVVQLDLARAGEVDKLDPKKKDDATTQLKKFYTALYRVYSGPTVYSDVNGEYRSMRQTNLSQSGDVLPARAIENVSSYKFQIDGKSAGYKTHYSGFSMWDTYRSQAQLLAMIAPDEASDMMQSLVADAQQCGAFPHWVDGSEDTTPMNGDHAPTVVAGSYIFGARKFDLEMARKYMRQAVTEAAGKCNDKQSIGKNDNSLADYMKLGWIPDGYDHPSSTTLEAITTDRSVGAFLDAQPATREIDKDLIQTVFKRAGNWQNIFDDASKTLLARTAAGDWTDGSFHESTEENYIWTFAYDWTRLVEKLGGKAGALDRLGKLFALDPADPFNGREPSGQDLNGRGLSDAQTSPGYYIGNEPAFQTPWAYNWIGSAKYAQYIIPVILRKNFSTAPGGLPGNDDMGATSGWFVWASMGLYPVIPSAPGLAVSTPQFSGMTLWLGNGKKLRIEADRQALIDNVRYIGEMKLNGTTYAGSWLPLDRIKDGGTLSFKLSTTPTDWASDPSLTPPSGPAADYTKTTAAGAM